MTSKGFTLIELIVSVIILLLLTALLVAGYTGFNNSQTVSQAATTLKNNLRAARTSAASGLKPEGCDELVGYGVNFSASDSYDSYTIGAYCTNSVNPVGNVSTYALPSGLHFSPVPKPLEFYVLDRGASRAETVTIQGVTTSVAVTVSLNGTVDSSAASGGSPAPCDRGCSATTTPTGSPPPPIP